MKKLVAILLCVMLLCSLAVPAFAAGSTITITASKTTLQRGDEFTITFNFAAGEAVKTAGFKLTADDIDRDVFEIVSGKTNLVANFTDPSVPLNLVVYQSESGKEGFALTYKAADLHKAEMGIITLRVKDTAKIGKTTITCTPSFNNSGVPVNVTSNTITIDITCEHKWGAWSNGGENGHTRSCTKCNTPETAQHDWDNGKVTTAATCAKDGVKTYACKTTGCDATKTEPISKDTVPHTYGDWIKDTDAQHKRTCTVSGCNAFETEAHKWDEGTLTKQGNCQERGEITHKCTTKGCTATKIEYTDPSKDHSLGKWEKISDTKHKRSCTISGCNFSEEKDHTWSTGTVTKAATCKEDGIKTYKCTDNCGAERTETISKDTVAHTYGSWVKESDTKHKHTCTVCATASESADHTWNNGAVTKTATCKEEGEKTYTCTGCGATKIEKIEKLKEHAWGKWTEVDATSHKRTCTVCGDSVSETAKHGETTKWTSDGTQHWHECADCKAKLDAAKHTPGAAATETTAQRCTVCNRILVPAKGHTHKWGTKYTTDAESHWYACSGCNEKKDAKAHDFANDCDTLCETCQYTRETTHKFGTEWTSDASGHWHACTSCGEKADAAEHAPGVEATETTAQTCTACGFELAPALGHTHAFSETWEKDDANHWHVCACGEKAEEAAHEWNENGLCPTCLAEKPVEETATNGGFPWWIILVAVLGIGAVVAIVIVGKKKKK